MHPDNLEFRRRCGEMDVEHERLVNHRKVDPDRLALMRRWAAGDPEVETEWKRLAAGLRRPLNPLVIRGRMHQAP